MLVDTDAIREFGTSLSSRADDLSAAAAALKSVPGSDATDAFGPVGAGFLAALADAAMTQAQAIVRLGADLEAAHAVTTPVADAYVDAECRNSRRL